MRKVAGILMIVGVCLEITILHAEYGFIPGLLGVLPWLAFGMVFGGGICTLKRRVWVICLISSIILKSMGIVLLFLISPVFVAITTPFGILPLVFILRRKREWE